MTGKSVKISVSELLVSGEQGVALLDPEDGAERWRTVLHEHSGLPANLRRWIKWYGQGVADEAKPVLGTDGILTTTVAGLVAIVSVSGAIERIAWETGAHSAELLPGGLVAVAVSNSPGAYPDGAPHGRPSRVVLHRRAASGQALDAQPVADAHGVMWEPKAGLLWVLGWDRLAAFAVGNGRLLSVAERLLPADAIGGEATADMISLPIRRAECWSRPLPALGVSITICLLQCWDAQACTSRAYPAGQMTVCFHGQLPTLLRRPGAPQSTSETGAASSLLSHRTSRAGYPVAPTESSQTPSGEVSDSDAGIRQ